MSIPQDPKSAVPDVRAPLPEESAGSFIVSLCALAEPAVPQPPPTDLEGLRAFVSRRTKDGVHRFYLHVGFFQTPVEAEEWLSAARAKYPTKYPHAFVSKLAHTLRLSDAGAPPVADTQMLKVLEARAPRRDSEVEDTGSYAVHSEWRVLGTPPAASAVAPQTPSPLTQAPPATTPAKPDVSKTPSPADAWNAFVASDSSSASGVRHLRVEFLGPRNRPVKPSKPHKR